MIILGVSALGGGTPGGNGTAKRDELSRRQAEGGFVGGSGGENPASCSNAAVFSIVDGQLTDGTGLVRVDPGVDFIEFGTSDTGSITRRWALDGTTVGWFNTEFFGGQAGFCTVPGGQVYVTFGEPSTFPADCVEASITSFQGKLAPHH